MEEEFVDYKIIEQGAPLVNYVYLVKKSDDIVALCIDLKSKYCLCDSFFSSDDGACSISILASENSIGLNDNCNKSKETIIEFLNYKKWYVFSAGEGRYNINICLIKND